MLQHHAWHLKILCNLWFRIWWSPLYHYHWSMLMENFLRSKEHWQVAFSWVAKPTANVVLTNTQKTELEEPKLRDFEVKNYLFQAIDKSISETILCKDTSKHIWDSMKGKYSKMSAAAGTLRGVWGFTHKDWRIDWRCLLEDDGNRQSDADPWGQNAICYGCWEKFAVFDSKN